MFTIKKTDAKPSRLEEAIDRLYDDMQTVDPNTDAYSKMADNLTKLIKLRADDKPARKLPSPDVLATVSANLIGIALIIHHERAEVITTKALGFVKKLG